MALPKQVSYNYWNMERPEISKMPIVEVQRLPRSGIEEIPTELLKELLAALPREEREAFEAWRDYEDPRLNKGPRSSSSGAAKALGTSKEVVLERVGKAIHKIMDGYKAEMKKPNDDVEIKHA